MKKNLFLSLAITFFFAAGLKAQTASLTVTIDNDIQASAGSVEIPVYLTFIDPTVEFGAFELIIQFDDDVLTPTDATPNFTVGGSFTANLTYAANQVRVAWAHTTSIKDSDLTDNILLTLKFDASVGQSDLTFINENAETGGSVFWEDNSESSKIVADFNNGDITITSPAPVPVPLSSWALFMSAGLFVVFIAVKGRRLF